MSFFFLRKEMQSYGGWESHAYVLKHRLDLLQHSDWKKGGIQSYIYRLHAKLIYLLKCLSLNCLIVFLTILSCLACTASCVLLLCAKGAVFICFILFYFALSILLQMDCLMHSLAVIYYFITYVI